MAMISEFETYAWRFEELRHIRTSLSCIMEEIKAYSSKSNTVWDSVESAHFQNDFKKIHANIEETLNVVDEYTRYLAPPSRNGMYYDPVEDTAEYKAVIKTVEEQVEAEMSRVQTARSFFGPVDQPIQPIRLLGDCYTEWGLKKRLLKEHGIVWHSPDEMNPNVCFD